MKHSVLLDIII